MKKFLKVLAVSTGVAVVCYGIFRIVESIKNAYVYPEADLDEADLDDDCFEPDFEDEDCYETNVDID